MTIAILLEKFLEVATPEQKKLLNKLYELAMEEKDISNKISKIYDSRKSGVYSNKDGITVCETEEDAMIISADLRDELALVRSMIVSELKRAIDELEMRDVGIIQRQYKNYIGDEKDGKKEAVSK